MDVLVGYSGDWNIVDINLLFADQIQQQIQRPCEYVKIYTIINQLLLLCIVRRCTAGF